MNAADHPSRPIVTTCDFCTAEVPLVLVEVVLLRMSDGYTEPEAWCPDCLREAQANGAMSQYGH